MRLTSAGRTVLIALVAHVFLAFLAFGLDFTFDEARTSSRSTAELLVAVPLGFLLFGALMVGFGLVGAKLFLYGVRLLGAGGFEGILPAEFVSVVGLFGGPLVVAAPLISFFNGEADVALAQQAWENIGQTAVWSLSIPAALLGLVFLRVDEAVEDGGFGRLRERLRALLVES